MLTQQDILAIKNALKEDFDRIDRRFDGIDERFEGVDRRFDGIDERFEGVDRRFDEIDERFEGVDRRFDGIDERFEGVDRRFDESDNRFEGIESRLDKLERDVKEIKIDLLENNVIPRLNTIEQCYLDTSKRYMESADKYDNAITDIEVMKLAIQKNSADIRELQLKQA